MPRRHLWLALLLLPACVAPAPPARSTAPAAAAPRPAPVGVPTRLELYVMSKCPYGVEVLQVAKELGDRLGPALELQIDYIVSEDESGRLAAMHGEDEVKGNILELCALRHSPRPRALRFITCLGRQLERIPRNWEGCAEEAGIGAEALMSCFTSPAGEKLLRESMRRARAAHATGSPTILVAGKDYDGPRGTLDLMRAVCAEAQPAPKACGALPPEVAVELLVLTDRRCASCRTEEMVATLRERVFRKLKVRTVDYDTEEGKRIYRELKLDGLPALLLGKSVESHPGHAMMAQFLEARGDYRLLRIKTRFDPAAEICDNGKDDTGDGKADCADPDCLQTLTCRREQPRRLEVFVMSQCPYAAQGLLAMKEVLKNFRGKLGFEIHYIVEPDGEGGFRSLHGAGEVEENIRQLCAKKHYGKGERYLNYVWGRFADYRSGSWQSCASKGISAQVIRRCAEGAEGRQLLAEDMKVARALGITGSPTWMANSRHAFHGISAEQVKQGVCKQNPKLAGCENKLSDDSAVPAGSCGD